MSKTMRWILAVIVLLTTAAAVWHLQSEPKVAGGVVLVRANDEESLVRLEDLPLEPVCGELTDGLGKPMQIQGEGIRLKDVLEMAGTEAKELVRVTVIAADSYRAEVGGEELKEEDKGWLLVRKDGAELVVFGDENRKRNVANVLQLEAE